MGDQDQLNEQKNLIESLALVLGREGNSVQLFETHISWVLVAGNFAYKFKKAVHFDFVDYSMLENRHFYCEEELRLNRRLAPHIYLSVVAVTDDHAFPVIDGKGAAIEYAVKMHAFEQQALWTYRIKHRLTEPDEIDKLATVIAQFHQNAAIASKSSRWCMTDAMKEVANKNLHEIVDLVDGADEKHWIGELQGWDSAQRQKLNHVFNKRKENGFIRECHGDLHSGNILTINDQVEVFDCIEFNESLRWIDVMNDVAFTCMDLRFQHRTDLAARFLNRYLEMTGDYEGLAVLRYYEIHRALVRGKVALLRARQLLGDMQQANQHEQLGKSYLAFSVQDTKLPLSALMITHGFSGSGKTTFARSLVELTCAVQLRSDVERKRMYGLSATERAAACPETQLYDAAATKLTYEHLRKLAKAVVESGRSVIVDAAFLKAGHRALFASLASELNIPFFIFDIRTDDETMRARIASRESLKRDASDAGLDVLAHQLTNHDMLSTDEIRNAITVDMNSDMNLAELRRVCRPVLDMIGNASILAPATR